MGTVWLQYSKSVPEVWEQYGKSVLEEWERYESCKSDKGQVPYWDVLESR